MLDILISKKQYGNKIVLNHVELSVQKGQILGIVGLNGAGKSTLIRCVAGIETYEGHARYNHAPLQKKDIAWMDTHPEFIVYMTGKEYLLFVAHARGIKVKDLSKLNIFDLPLDEYAVHYSTGMKKKLVFSSLLMINSQIICLDEPFSGVDLPSNILMNEIISRWVSTGRIVIIASHILSTLTEMAHQIAFLENGSEPKLLNPQDYDLLEKELRERIVNQKLGKAPF